MTTCRVCGKDSPGENCPHCGTSYDSNGYAVIDLTHEPCFADAIKLSEVKLNISRLKNVALDSIALALILFGIIMFFLAIGSHPVNQWTILEVIL